MKIKITALVLVLTMIAIMLSSCAFSEVLKFANNIMGVLGIGDDDSTTNNINIVLPGLKRCKNHVIEPLAPIAPTCTTPGLTSGQVCTQCATVIVAQVEIPALDHTYDDVRDDSCNVCGFVRQIKCEHTVVVTLEAKAPTCSSTGRTQGEQCVGCEKILAGYEVINPIDHTYDNDEDSTCNVCEYVREIQCKHKITQKLETKAPTCTETGLTQGRACSECGEILVVQQEIPVIDHVEGDWIVDKAPSESEEGEMHTECIMCQSVLRTGKLPLVAPDCEENASNGLVFVLNEDQNSYSLVDVGSCTDVEVIIPRYYKGLPVTKIGDGAFLNKEEITRVVIPEGLLNIGNGAFRSCTGLESVVFPSTLTSIGEYAFYNCALSSLALPEGVTEIKKYTFYACHFEKVEIPYGVVSIGEGAFAECVLAVELDLPYSLEIIGAKAFYNVSKVTAITLPKSVKIIGDRAFNNDTPSDTPRTIIMFNYVSKIGAYAFTANSTINYKGRMGEWNNILIDPRNYQYNVVALDGSFID